MRRLNKRTVKIMTAFSAVLVAISVMFSLMQPGIALTGSEVESDPNADVEDASVWQASFANSGYNQAENWNEAVTAIAESQIGYAESTNNFNEENKGYTRYGAWASSSGEDKTYNDWNTLFVEFVLHYAGVYTNYFPVQDDVQTWIQSLSNKGLYTTEYTEGDLVFFNKNGSTSVGIIDTINESSSSITVIEGDSNDRVEENTYTLNSNILGYGSVSTAYSNYQEALGIKQDDSQEETDSSSEKKSSSKDKEEDTQDVDEEDIMLADDETSEPIEIGVDERTTSKTTLKTKATESETQNGYSRDKEFEFELNYTLGNALATDGVYTAYYDLPSTLTEVKSLSGTQEGTIWDGGTKVGTYKIVTEGDHQRVVFTYTNTEWLENHSSDVSGTFKFYAKVSKSASNNKQKTEIVFPGKDNKIDVPFEDGKVTGSKWHQVNADGTIDFTITFNVTGEDENVTLTDTLGSNLEFIKDGTYTLDGNAVTPSIEGSVATFKFSNLTIGQHTIKYKAKVSDIKDLDSTNNKIDWKYSGLSKKEYEDTYTDKVSFQKEGTTKVGQYDSTTNLIKWTVTVTPSNFDSVAGKTIKDTLTSANHKYDGTASVVTDQWNPNTSVVDTFTLNSKSDSFSYTFGDNVQWETGKTYYIIYYTSPTDLPKTGDGTTKHTYTNSIDGGPTGSVEITEPGSGGSGGGGSGGIDTKIDIVTKSATVLADKHIAWEITIDPSRYDGENKTLTDLKLVDRLDNYSWSGSKFDKDSFKFQDADGKELDYVQGVDYELTFDDDNGTFTLVFKTMPKSKVNLIYQTYTNNTGTNQKNYVDSSYTIDGKSNNETDNAYGAYDEKGSPLTKTGVIEGNKITWTIVMDAQDSHYWFGSDTKPLGTYTIKDILPNGLTYVDDTAKYTLTTSEWNHSTDVTNKKITPTIDGNNLLFDIDIQWNQSLKVVLTFETYVDTPLPTESDTDHGVTVDGNKVIYHNDSTFERDGLVYSKASGDAEITNKILDKKASLGENNSIKYKIVVNYEAADLLPNSDELELVDTLDVNSEIDLSSIKVTNLNTGESVPCTKGYSMSGQNGILTLKVPDSKALLVEYSVNVAGEKGDKLTITNSAYLKGVDSSDTSVEQEITIVETEATARGDKTSITLSKIDDQSAKVLSGATFELHRINLDTKEDALIETKVTSTNGKVEFKDLLLNELYYYVEIKSPDGYKLDGTKHYFMIKGSNDEYTKAYAKVPSDIKEQLASIAGANTILVPNSEDKSYELPSTGGTGTLNYYFCGTAIMSIAVLLYVYIQTRCRRRRNCS